MPKRSLERIYLHVITALRAAPSTLRRPLTVSAGCVVAGLFLAAPAFAETPAPDELGRTVATFGAVPWVQSTIISVGAVFALWFLLASTFRMAQWLRWVSPHRFTRLSRALQVGGGGLLLMAVFVPYLAAHHPLLAVGFPVLATLSALVFGLRAPRVIDQNPGY